VTRPDPEAEVIEAAARAMLDWDRLSDTERNDWRADLTVAIEAADEARGMTVERRIRVEGGHTYSWDSDDTVKEAVRKVRLALPMPCTRSIIAEERLRSRWLPLPETEEQR
jgi:hypothetical protein